MPRPNLAATKTTGNHRVVTYVKASGRGVDAEVTGGSGTSLNLRIPHYPVASRNKTGIAKRTAIGQTNVWF